VLSLPAPAHGDQERTALRRVRGAATKEGRAVKPRHEAAMGLCVRAAHICGVDPEDILGDSRTKTVATARAVTLWATRKLLNWSYPEIGKAFDRDHTTVMSACSKVERELRNPTPGNLTALVARRMMVAGVTTTPEARELPN
jgi:hypothetical protein